MLYSKYKLSGRTGFDCLQIQQIPKPDTKYGQVLVRIKAVALNHRDCAIANGTYPFPGPESGFPGSDGAGVIHEVGEGVDEWKVGDRVAIMFVQGFPAGRMSRRAAGTCLSGGRPGILGEYALLSQDSLVKIPDYLSFVEASSLSCAGVTAWNALYGLCPLRPGQIVLLQGTGGVSMFGLQIAHAAGAVTIVTSSSDDKLQKAKQLGATHCINYRSHPDWAAEVMRLTGGNGADYILEIGGQGTLSQSFKAIGYNGVIVAVGYAATESSAPEESLACIKIDEPFIFRRIICGSREQFEDMLSCLRAHGIRPIIDKVFPFVEASRAYEYLWTTNHIGKVVISID